MKYAASPYVAHKYRVAETTGLPTLVTFDCYRNVQSNTQIENSYGAAAS